MSSLINRFLLNRGWRFEIQTGDGRFMVLTATQAWQRARLGQTVRVSKAG